MNARFVVAVTIFATAPLFTGCSSMSNTGKGALVGGGLGAGAGALIDRATGGKGGTGAIVGAAGGALLGGAIGNEEDQREKAALNNRVRQADDRAAAAANQLGIADIIQLTKDGRSDELIINQIKTTNSTYQLSTEDVRLLGANGVSDRVTMEMQNRRPDRHPRPRYIMAPPPPPGMVYVLPPPPPPPPPGFGVGFSIHN